MKKHSRQSRADTDLETAIRIFEDDGWTGIAAFIRSMQFNYGSESPGQIILVGNESMIDEVHPDILTIVTPGVTIGEDDSLPAFDAFKSMAWMLNKIPDSTLRLVNALCAQAASAHETTEETVDGRVGRA